MYRQGDLLFIESNIPKDSIEKKDGVIATGETTGHRHRIGDAKAILLIYAGLSYIRAISETEIVHDEHATISLPKGEYAVTRQREYTPDGWQVVAD